MLEFQKDDGGKCLLCNVVRCKILGWERKYRLEKQENAEEQESLEKFADNTSGNGLYCDFQSLENSGARLGRMIESHRHLHG